MKNWKHLTLEQRKVISNGISHNYKLKELLSLRQPKFIIQKRLDIDYPI